MHKELTTQPLRPVTENYVLGERNRNFTQPHPYSLHNSESMADLTKK